MKKIKMLFVVSVMLGVGASVFAQPVPRGAEMAASHRMDAALKANLERGVAASQVVNTILKEGTEVAFDYTILVKVPSNHPYGYVDKTRNFSGNGVEWSDGKHTYFLLARADWENMYDKCMPCGIYRTFRGDTIKKQTISILKKNMRTTYSFFKDGLLNHNHYKVNGKEYTVITLK